jgi:uncharacterized membrane protein YkoI
MGHYALNSSVTRRIIIAVTGAILIIAIGTTAIISDNPGANASSKLDNGVYLVSDVEVSPESAIEIALSERNGRVEDVDLELHGSEYIYEIRISDKDVFIDAMTGEPLVVENDNDDGFTSPKSVSE